MSTVLPSEIDELGAPLAGIDDLVELFRAAEKPRADFRVGTEHEAFGVLRAGHAPLPFFGSPGIEEILRAIAADPLEQRGASWTPVQDAGHTIALFGPAGSITLEPGGQLELSGAPLRTIHETSAELDRHLALLGRVCEPRGLGLAGMGFHPTARRDQIPDVPKARYAIMRRFMPLVGARGLDMMKRTATVQANFDWADEGDMALSFAVALRAAPLVAALFANSPFVEGRPSGALSERQRVWADTDRRRAGFPAVVLEPGFGYRRWVETVLDVPMYFVRRDGVHHDVAGASFRDFMEQGLVLESGPARATLRDFSDHLTTVFFEVRLKRVLEVRSADSGPRDHICALPALHKGLLYDTRAREQASELLEFLDADALGNLRRDVAERGFSAQTERGSILMLCERLLDIAVGGLMRQAGGDGHGGDGHGGDGHGGDGQGQDESGFLRPLIERVEHRETLAERLLRRYREQGGDLAGVWQEVELLDGSSPPLAPLR